MGELGDLDHRLADVLYLLVDEFSRLETVDPKHLKGYLIRAEAFSGGEGAPVGCLHLEASVLEGRPIELRAKMADTLDAVLRYETTGTAVAVTVEVREMVKDVYRRMG
jgi:5-carboxymethyl-2-hydroxymuconate isomerase